MTTPDPAALARRLSPAQRDAFSALPWQGADIDLNDGWDATCALLYALQMAKLGLMQHEMITPTLTRVDYTDLGQRVRAELERMELVDGG